jgi:hypothetical protein
MIIVIRVRNISKDLTSFKTTTIFCDVQRRISYRQTNTSLDNGIHSYVQETIWNPWLYWNVRNLVYSTVKLASCAGSHVKWPPAVCDGINLNYSNSFFSLSFSPFRMQEWRGLRVNSGLFTIKSKISLYFLPCADVYCMFQVCGKLICYRRYEISKVKIFR